MQNYVARICTVILRPGVQGKEELIRVNRGRTERLSADPVLQSILCSCIPRQTPRARSLWTELEPAAWSFPMQPGSPMRGLHGSPNWSRHSITYFGTRQRQKECRKWKRDGPHSTVVIATPRCLSVRRGKAYSEHYLTVRPTMGCAILTDNMDIGIRRALRTPSGPRGVPFRPLVPRWRRPVAPRMMLKIHRWFPATLSRRQS
jgi:hypothetical protein